MTVQFDRVYNLFNRQEPIRKSLIKEVNQNFMSIGTIYSSVCFGVWKGWNR